MELSQTLTFKYSSQRSTNTSGLKMPSIVRTLNKHNNISKPLYELEMILHLKPTMFFRHDFNHKPCKRFNSFSFTNTDHA